MEKAQTEYKKYKAKTLSSVEKDYLESIKRLEQKGKQWKWTIQKFRIIQEMKINGLVPCNNEKSGPKIAMKTTRGLY